VEIYQCFKLIRSKYGSWIIVDLISCLEVFEIGCICSVVPSSATLCLFDLISFQSIADLLAYFWSEMIHSNSCKLSGAYSCQSFQFLNFTANLNQFLLSSLQTPQYALHPEMLEGVAYLAIFFQNRSQC
jgi:hypothetical protein